MVETKASGVGDYSIGHLRIKYLDLANICFAQNNIIQAKYYVDSFVGTLDGKSEAGKMVKDEFDRIVLVRNKRLQEIDNVVKNLGYLERKDLEDKGKTEAEVNMIHDMKEICWRISLKQGLFND